MRFPSSPRLRLTAGSTLLLALLAAAPSFATTPAFQVGVTHTQYTADEWRNPTAITRAKDVLRASVRLQAEPLMGWGANNPEPSPGTYDWGTFDERLRLIKASGGTPVVTLC